MKLFRKIRAQQLLNNHISKYLLYAIGEIVLVIIGILIALYINNQNELKKKETNAKVQFTSILKELKSDIEESSRLIDFYRTKDSLTNIVLSGKLTVEDYKNPKNQLLHGVTSTYETYRTTQHGYDALLQDLDQVPAKYDEAIDIMNALYKENKSIINTFNETIHRYVLKNIEYSAANHDWFSSINLNESINYKLNSPKYKNEVSVYRSYVFGNLVPAIKRYRSTAITAYNHIAVLLDVPIDKEVFNLNQRLPDSYLGYYYEEDSKNLLKVSRKGNEIHVHYPNIGYEGIIYPYKDTVFYDMGNIIYTFKTSGKNKTLRRSLMNLSTQYIQIDSAKMTSTLNPTYEVIEVSEAQIQKYLGKYQLLPEMILTISRDGEQMKVQATGQPAVDMVFVSKNKLYAKMIDGTITFNEGANQEVESLTLVQNGMTIDGKKLMK